MYMVIQLDTRYYNNELLLLYVFVLVEHAEIRVYANILQYCKFMTNKYTDFQCVHVSV